MSSIQCPHCDAEVRYTRFAGMADLAPHFYCDSCSNLFFRESDRDLLRNQEPSASLLEMIARTLPRCPCGGWFVAGSNPKCPSCRRQIAHQSDPISRLTDPHAILMEGARFVKGEPE